MHCRFRGACLIFTLLLILAATPPAAQAELIVHDRDRLEALAERMDASLARIRTIRATVRSQTFAETDGRRTLRARTGPTHWISDGDRYRYETTEHVPSMPESIPTVHQAVADGEEPIAEVSVTPSGTAMTRRLVRALSNAAVIEYDPEHPGRASIGNVDQLHAALHRERFRHDPRHAGVTVLGVTLTDILDGESWRARPEDLGAEATRTVRWGGQRLHDGRTVEVVQVEVAWEAKGHRAVRSYELLIDPQRGYTVPRMVGHYTLDEQRQPFESLDVDLAKDASGLWLPRRAEHRLALGASGTGGSLITEVQIEDTVVNAPVAPEALLVDLEPGALLQDHALNYRFRYARGADREIVEEIGQTLASRTRRTDGAGTVSPAVGTTALPIVIGDGDGAAGWWWWVAGGALAVSALILFIMPALGRGAKECG